MIALPLMEAMRDVAFEPRTAEAQSGVPRRFLYVATTNGTFPERYWPVPPGADAAKQWAARKNHENRTVSADDAFSTGDTALATTEHTFSPIIKPLEKHRADLTFVEGLEIFDGIVRGHDGLNDMLRHWTFGHLDGGLKGTGWTNGASVDQLIARHIGKGTKFESLQTSVLTNNTNYCTMAWKRFDQGLVPESNPQRVFDVLFKDLTSPTAPNPELEQIRAERKSILDAALTQANAIKAQVSKLDGVKLDQYLDAIRSVETRLQAAGGAGAGCRKPERPGLDHTRDENMPALVAAQTDLLVMAFACDLTRVMTFQIGLEGGEFRHPHLGINQGFHMALVHANQYEKIEVINHWYAEQVSLLIDKLKGVSEGGKSLFDSTFMLWGIPMGPGSTHRNLRAPLMFAGTSGGYFKPGQHVRFAKGDRRSFADLYVCVLRSFGIDANSFGAENASGGSIKWPINHKPTDELRA